MKKILFSGEIPPKSVHGVSFSNDINIRILQKRFDVKIDEEIVDFKYHGKFDLRKSFNFIKRIFRIIGLSIVNKFDYFYIVLSTSTVGAIKTLLLILIFRLLNRSKVVVHIHRGDLENFVHAKPINQKVFSIIEKLTSKFIVLSSETKSFLLERCNVHVDVLENTVTSEKYLHQTKPPLNLKLDFVFISNYIKEKGILILLEAFSKLPNNFILNCYGSYTDLPLKSKIEDYSSKYDNIIVNPPINGDHKFERIFKADALILPSFNEGKPLVLLEAMSVGTPFIANNVGYIKEIPYEGYPYLYETNTTDDLVGKIVEFSNASDNLEISASLKDRYIERFSNIIHTRKLNEIFK
jgi:glycosyltransferase involved in cell wall biosynthesis